MLTAQILTARMPSGNLFKFKKTNNYVLSYELNNGQYFIFPDRDDIYEYFDNGNFASLSNLEEDMLYFVHFVHPEKVQLLEMI